MMKYVYRINKKHVFLTFRRYSIIIDKLEKDNILTKDETMRSELPFGDYTERKKVNKAIEQYLINEENKNPEFFKNSIHFVSCYDDDAVENITNFLAAVSFVHKNFKLIGKPDIDIRFDYGQTFSFIYKDTIKRLRA